MSLVFVALQLPQLREAELYGLKFECGSHESFRVVRFRCRKDPLGGALLDNLTVLFPSGKHKVSIEIDLGALEDSFLPYSQT